MEALINRIPFLPLLIATGFFLFGGTTLHAQSQSPLKTTPDDAVAVPPAADEGDTTVTPENESELRDVNSTSDPDLESAIADHEQLREDFELYKKLLANNMIAEADVVAKRIVELSIRRNGFESADTARALTNLAIVQHRNKNYETAKQNYEAAIGIIEQVEDRLSPDLINPLRGLGSAQLASGRPDQALDTFNRARHVSHVNEGPHNLDQIRILESLAEIYIYMGEYEDAYDLQDRVYALYARKYDTKSEEIIPALYKRAAWQHRVRLYGRERETYRRVIRIIEKNQDKKSLDLVRPLIGLGNAYLFVGAVDPEFHRDSTMTTGEIYLKRAKRIVEEHPDATWELKESTFLSLADFYIFSAKSGKAIRAYQDTWDLLSEDESRMLDRYNQLEASVLLQDINPPKYHGIDEDSAQLNDDDQFEQGKVVAKFMINTHGRARNFEIIEVHPAGLEEMEQAVLKEMRRLIYRPRLENREAVETENMTYTHEFFYRESDLLPVDEPEEPDSPTRDDAEEVAADNSDE
ncbi:MAG: tetratricopeptide repeat protein [Woeseiaceae bacterium]